MNAQYTISSPTEPLDGPFAKLRLFMLGELAALGFPSAASNNNLNASNLYQQAAEILELINPDTEYVAAKIRHLDFIARTSRLADRMTWRSVLKNTWNENRIFDRPVGFFSTMSTPNVILSGAKIKLKMTDRMVWNYTLAATTDTTNSTFILEDLKGGIVQAVIPRNTTQTIALGDSGYNLQIQNNLNANQSMTGIINIRWPYALDLIKLKNNIITNTDFLTQLAVNSADLLMYFTSDNSVEDVLAAFLLAVHSL